MSSVLYKFPSTSPTSPDAFIPRHFPPPALRNVPVLYILEQLHNLAVDFWDQPDTADCTIIIPISPFTLPASYSTPKSPNFPSMPSPLDPAAPLPPGSNLRGPAHRAALNQAQMNRATRMTCKLHLDYLLAQSSLFRNLFRNGCILDSGDSKGPNTSTDSLASLSQSSISGIPPSRLPRLLSSSTPTHPVVLLPLPDPSSFPHLMHFMYFGTFTALETALNNGQLKWSAVVRNVEYLGMRSSVKAFLGRWYARQTVLDSSGRGRSLPFVCGDDSDSASGDIESSDEYDSADAMEIDEDSSEEHDNVSLYSNSDAEFDDVECESDSDTDESLATLVDTPPPGDIIASKAIAILSQTEQHPALLDDEFEPRRGRTRTRMAIDPYAPSVSPARSKHKV